jgi:hypothetical protein
LVRKEGVEPPRPFGHKILSLARLPVPPLPQWWLYSTRWQRDAAMGFGWWDLGQRIGKKAGEPASGTGEWDMDAATIGGALRPPKMLDSGWG